MLKRIFSKQKGFTPTPNASFFARIGAWVNPRNGVRNNTHTSKVWGFTLIELLVVIAIIGVLASVVLASLNNARRKSRDARRISDLKQLQLALELYFDSSAGNGNYPIALASLAPDYIPQVPTDPSGNDCGASANYCYAYQTTGTRTTYHIGANLEDTANSALSSDRDCNSITGTGCPTGLTAATGGFDGTDAGNCEAAGTLTYRCYDLAP